MVIATCLEKLRNKHNVIIGYVLQDEKGTTKTFDSKAVKEAIMAKKLYVKNLQLDARNRLIDKNEEIVEEQKDITIQTSKTATQNNVANATKNSKPVEVSVLTNAKSLTPSSLGQTLVNSSGMNVSDRITRCLLVLRNVAPFYYAIIYNLKKVETTDVPTAGVSLDTLYYNPNFVNDISNAELIFLLLHEVCHIVMQHNLRQRQRETTLWNVACDIYINTLLIKEYDLDPMTKSPKKLNSVIPCDIDLIRDKDTQKTTALYDLDIDVNTETAETIYEKIMQNSNSESNGTSNDNSNSNSSNNNSNNDSSSNSNSNDNSNGTNNNSSNSNSENNSNENNSNSSGKTISVRVINKSMNVNKDKYDKDLIKTTEDVNKTQEQQKNLANSILEKAKVLVKNNSYTTDSFDGLLREFVEKALKKEINWKAVINTHLAEISAKEYSIMTPDRRFVSRNIYLPGERKITSNKFKNVKVCIDTSGSITDEELGEIKGTILKMLKAYKMSGEIIFWDTQVQKIVPFEERMDIVKAEAKGCGGTDVSCIFEYFLSRECKYKPSYILVFTDGQFYVDVINKYPQFRANLIWILTTDYGYQNFKPPFGKIAPFKN